jgi:hypothetical protein
MGEDRKSSAHGQNDANDTKAEIAVLFLFRISENDSGIAMR